MEPQEGLESTISSLEHRTVSLEVNTEDKNRPLILSAFADLRAKLLEKVCDSKDAEVIDNWASSLSDADWRTWLSTRGLDELNFEYVFLLAQARELRESMRPDFPEIHVMFACLVVHGAKEGNEYYLHYMETYSAAFEFTYGMGWEEAARIAIDADHLGF